MDVIGLNFKALDFNVQFRSNDIAKAKLAILATLYCEEFVKNPIVQFN